MPQTTRKQNKILKKLKILSLLISVLFLFGIVQVAASQMAIKKSLYLNPVSQSQTSSSFANLLRQKDIKYQEIEEEVDYYVLKIDSKKTVYISKNKNIEEELSSLQLILNRLKIEGKDFTSLDLRYSSPVIKN